MADAAGMDPAAMEAEASSTLPMRIAAIFIIMVVSLLGCLFPLLVLDLNGRAKWTNNLPLTPSSRNLSDGERVFQGSHAMHLLKSFSAGIILAVGFCHVLAEANEVLSEHVEFPLAFFVAMMGSISVLALSQVVDGLVSGMEKRGKAPGPALNTECLDMLKTNMTRVIIDAPEDAPESSPSARAPNVSAEEFLHQQEQQHLTGGSTDSDSSGEIALGSMANGGDRPLSSSNKRPSGLFIDPPPPPKIPDMRKNSSSNAVNTVVAAPPAQLPSFVSPRAQTQLKTFLGTAAAGARKEGFVRNPSFPREPSSQHNHNHGGGGHNDAVHVVQAFKQHTLAIAYLMEVGIVFHSILIGIGLGTATQSVANTRTLLVAISVHQFFEGAGLSTCILEAHLERKKNAMMFGLFSVTTSIGIAIGIGISKIYDEGSRNAAIVEGIFNAFAAGILIYLALVDILQEEFNRREVKKHRAWQVQMMMCVLLGAGVMSVIAIWA